MEAEEILASVEELENRLERLRVLYDQYFMGIEKIPPAVPQKDVDRRIWILRRERIRNTGIRFRFQTICQRYNTFQSFWGRICREIENGTYKRHVQKAQAKMAAEKTREREEVHEIDLDLDVELELGSLEEEAAPAVPVQAPASPPKKPFVAHLPQISAPIAPVSKADSPEPANRAPLTAQPVVQRSVVAAARPTARELQAVPKILAHKLTNDADLDAMFDDALGASSKPVAKPMPAAIAPVPKAVQPTPALVIEAKPEPPAPVAPKPVAPAPARAPQPIAERQQPKPVPRISDDPYRTVYERYVEARRKNGESTAGVTYESLAKNLRETSEKLKTRAGGKSVEFDVVVKDGKTILKPVVR